MANCTNCGTLVEEGALFCRNCGAKLEASPVATPAMEAPVMAPMQGAPMTGMPAEPKRKKKFPVVLVSVIAAVLVIAIVVVVILLTRRTEVSINSFISLEYSGYDTLGTAEIVFDSDAFEEKYGDKIKDMSGKEDEYLDAIDFLEDELEDSAYLEKDSDLTNGDVVKFTWDIDKEYIEETLKIKLKYSDMEFTVEGLTELATYDPFDNIDVTFEGYNTVAHASIHWNYGDDNVLMNHLWYECDNYNDLSNGDELTITLYLNSWIYDSIDELCISNGYKPIELTKTYKVEGLTELTEIDIFEDVVVNFSGINGEGDANIGTDSDKHFITELNFQLDKDYDLSNGDTVVASAWTWYVDVEHYLAEYGYIPKELEKTYTVSGLGSYVESVEQFPADFLSTADAAGRAVYEEEEVQFWSDVICINDMELLNTYFMTYNYDDNWHSVGKNCLALVYKNTVDLMTTNGEAQSEYYTTVVFQDVLMREDGSIVLDDAYSYVDYGFYMFNIGNDYFGVNGFETYEEAYDEFVGYYADSYTATCLSESTFTIEGLDSEKK